MIIDLHTHSLPYSYDSDLTPSEVVELCKQAGLDGVCLTEHDEFWEKQDLIKLGREHDLLVLPGVELSTDIGHILVFGVDSYAFGMHRAEFVREVVNREGGFMILAHPYREKSTHLIFKSSLEELHLNAAFELVDALEYFNGRSTDRENQISRELGERLNLKGSGGSDAHKRGDIPSYATYFDRDIHNLEELVAELKTGRFRPVDLRHRGAEKWR